MDIKNLSQAFLISLFKKGYDQEQVVSKLVEDGYEKNEVYPRVTEVHKLFLLNEIENKKRRKKESQWNLKFGLILIGIAIFAQVSTYFLTGGIGYFFLYGFYIGGFYYLIKYFLDKDE